MTTTQNGRALTIGLTFLTGVLFAVGGFAVSASEFITLRLAGGIAVDVPRAWVQLSKSLQDARDTAVEAAIDLSGVVPQEDRIGKPLLSLGTPKGQPNATLTIHSGTGEAAKQAELASLTVDELKAQMPEHTSILQKVLQQLGYRLIALAELKVEKINHRYYLVSRYRSHPTGSPTTVFRTVVYQYEDSKRWVTFTAMCEERAKQIFDPIFRRSLVSMKIDDGIEPAREAPCFEVKIANALKVLSRDGSGLLNRMNLRHVDCQLESTKFSGGSQRFARGFGGAGGGAANFSLRSCSSVERSIQRSRSSLSRA